MLQLYGIAISAYCIKRFYPSRLCALRLNSRSFCSGRCVSGSVRVYVCVRIWRRETFYISVVPWYKHMTILYTWRRIKPMECPQFFFFICLPALIFTGPIFHTWCDRKTSELSYTYTPFAPFLFCGWLVSTSIALTRTHDNENTIQKS